MSHLLAQAISLAINQGAWQLFCLEDSIVAVSLAILVNNPAGVSLN